MMKLLSILKFSTIFTTVASPATVTKPEANFSILGQGFRTKAEAKKFIDSKSLYYFNDSNNYDIARVKHDEKSAKNYLFNKHGKFDVIFNLKSVSPVKNFRYLFANVKSKDEVIDKLAKDYCEIIKDYGYMKHVKIRTISVTGIEYLFAEAYDTTKAKACDTAARKMPIVALQKGATYKGKHHYDWPKMENLIWKDHQSSLKPWKKYFLEGTNITFEKNKVEDTEAKVINKIKNYWKNSI